jgi:hypothetical protein
VATAIEISQTRVLVNDAGTPQLFTDDAVSIAVDEHGTVELAAGHLWLAKAASYADLTDVTEGTSRRDLGSLYKNALAMAKALGAMDPDDTPVDDSGSRQPGRTRAITRV